MFFEARPECLVWTSIDGDASGGSIAWSDVESADVDGLGNVDLYGRFGETWNICRLPAD